jgi:WD40 repeat protein
LYSSRNHRVSFISIIALLVVAMLISSCRGDGDETMGSETHTTAVVITATPEPLPNLMIKETWIEMGGVGDCIDPDHPQYKAQVEIVNDGSAESGAFHVLVNVSHEEAVSELGQGESVMLEFILDSDRLQVTLDHHKEVIEENELDNFLEVAIDISSLPVCTPIVEAQTSTSFSVYPLLPADMPITILQIQMFNENAGWGIGEIEKDVQHILRTKDGGWTWLDVTPPEIVSDSDISFMRATAHFMDIERAWITFQSDPHGQPGIVWHTDDAGLTWQSGWDRMPGIIGSASSWPVFDFADGETGWMLINHFVGESNYEAELFRTEDGGLTWEQIQNDQVSPWVVGSVGGMDFFNTSKGVLTSTNPLQAGVYVYWTGDGGTKWIEQKLASPDTNQDLFNLLFCGVSAPVTISSEGCLLSVYCYNEDGLSVPYLYQSDNKGNTWEAYPFPGNFKGTSIDVVNPDLIFVLGRKVGESGGVDFEEGGELYRSIDRGENWSNVAALDWYGPIHFIDGQLGWGIAMDQEGTALFHTEDGGLTWENLQPLTNTDKEYLRTVANPGGIVLPQGLLPLTPKNIDKIQLLDLQIPSQVLEMAFSSDGEMLILTQEDGWIIQWPVLELAYPLAAYHHQGTFIDTEVALDGVTVVSASQGGAVWVWFRGSSIQFSIDVGENEISSLALSSNGNILAVALEDGLIEMWDLSENLGRQVGSFNGDFLQWSGVALSRDGLQMVASSSEGDILVWDPTTGEKLSQWVGHSAAVPQIAFAPDGLLLASASADGSLILWDPSPPVENLVLNDNLVCIESMVFSPDGGLLAAACEDGNLYLWDTHSGQLMEVLSAGSPITSVAFSPSGEVIAAASRDGFIRFWGVQTLE